MDGKVLTHVDAYGKHLLYRFEDDLSVHVHLGLFGKFRRYKLPGPPTRETTRLRFLGEERGMDLAGAVISQLIDPAEENELMARLGPDPLVPRTRVNRLRTALARRKIPVGAALLDQSVIAGLGNIYRAEILFACGIDPHRESRSLTRRRGGLHLDHLQEDAPRGREDRQDHHGHARRRTPVRCRS